MAPLFLVFNKNKGVNHSEKMRGFKLMCKRRLRMLALKIVYDKHSYVLILSH